MGQTSDSTGGGSPVIAGDTHDICLVLAVTSSVLELGNRRSVSGVDVERKTEEYAVVFIFAYPTKRLTGLCLSKMPFFFFVCEELASSG